MADAAGGHRGMMSDDDRTFWIDMRRGLLGLASVETDAAKRRSLLQMIVAIERRVASPHSNACEPRERPARSIAAKAVID